MGYGDYLYKKQKPFPWDELWLFLWGFGLGFAVHWVLVDLGVL